MDVQHIKDGSNGCAIPAAISLRFAATARAGKRRFWLFSALCTHTKAPYRPLYYEKR
jgi:hypothetical protein